MPEQKTPGLPDGLRVYAIGDIHGRADLLTRTTEYVAMHLQQFPIRASVCIFLGDYVDRGPDSRSVLEMLTSGFPTQIVPLRGNHELMLLDFLRDPATAANWRYNGGIETLHSYGLDVSGFRSGAQFQEVAEQFRVQLPPEHLEFIRSTRQSISIGDYFFCHAGVRPRIPLEQQREEDLLWIRDEFLSSEFYHGKVVVHGHTPVLKPEIKHNRVNIDTGAYISGRLTTLVLEGERQEFFST